MDRRSFLRTGIATAVSVLGGPACGSSADETNGDSPPTSSTPGGDGPGDAGKPPLEPASPTSPEATSDTFFPQGIASGDPRADRVVLWTRADPAAFGAKETDDLELEWVIAEDEALTKLLARGKVVAAAKADHTVHLVPTELAPGTHYYFRFQRGETTTQVARTKTAPAPDDARPIRFAFASCQDYTGRYYHAWSWLLTEEDVDFVLFLGDYIYELAGDPKSEETRKIALPDGVDISKNQDGTRIAAKTLADYRTLYRAYRTDPTLRRVHRRYPFISMWDDHEFANDGWRDHATDFAEKDPSSGAYTDERDRPRREAASRAWAEHQPVEMTYATGKSFPFDLRTYRSFRFGKHVELFMTDGRLYRDDHVIGEASADAAVGKILANSMIGSRAFVLKNAFDSRESSRRPTMLGAEQRAWLTNGIKGSTASWKVWANGVQLAQHMVDLSTFSAIPSFLQTKLYISVDQWDGYRSERAEILHEIASVPDVVAFTGDIHAFYASELKPSFDTPGSPTAAVEYVVASITSETMGETIGTILGENAAFASLATALGGVLDSTLLASNPTLKVADSDAHGYGIAVVDAEGVQVTFVETGDVETSAPVGTPVRQRLRTPRGAKKIEKL